nr:copia protein [Tanacetum cinerariifolium]
MKGIKREFSVARTPQQNGVAEKKNRTLFEATRTMLADSLLPIPFWAKTFNTECYVQNRVLVTKPYNKTPYELLLGRSPSIGFMRPFGCPVTILNTLDPLGMFDGKADEGFLDGYSVNSKAFRVFNSRTRIVQETLHINFLENKPSVVGIGPKWLFDIDTLTQSMNYQPVVVRNQPNNHAGIKENLDAGKVGKETVSAQQYVLLPLWFTGSQDPQNTDDATFDIKENENDVHVSPSGRDKTKKQDDKAKRNDKGKCLIDLSTGFRDLRSEFEEFSINSTNRVNAASAPVTTAGPNLTNSTNSFNNAIPSDTDVSPNFGIDRKSLFIDPSNYPDDPDIPALEDIVYSDDEEDVSAEADFSNLETHISVSPIPTIRGHTQEEGIDYDEVFAPLERIEAIRLFLAYASFMGFMVYQMDVKSDFVYGIIKEEVYVCQPPGFKDPNYPDKVYKVVKALYGPHQAPRAWYETLANYLLENGFQRGKIDQTLFTKKKKGDILLVQVYVDDIIFGSTNKELCKAFERLMNDKFQMSSMGELTFYLGLKVKQKDDGIFISQDKYVAEILRKFSFTYVKSASTP